CRRAWHTPRKGRRRMPASDHAGRQLLQRRLRTEVTASCNSAQRRRVLPQIEIARRLKRLIWLKGAVSALTLATGSGATVIEEGSARRDQLCPRKSTNCCPRQGKSRSKPPSRRLKGPNNMPAEPPQPNP